MRELVVVVFMVGIIVVKAEVVRGVVGDTLPSVLRLLKCCRTAPLLLDGKKAAHRKRQPAGMHNQTNLHCHQSSVPISTTNTLTLVPH